MATGTISLNKKPKYATKGPTSVFDVKQALPEMPKPRCYVNWYPLTLSCSEEQMISLAAGNATVVDRVVVDPPA
jgi:hypothetical protein